MYAYLTVKKLNTLSQIQQFFFLDSITFLKTEISSCIN